MHATLHSGGDSGAGSGDAAGVMSFQLMYLAHEGNAEGIRELLDASADPNFRDSDGRTALHIVACEGHTEVVELLLDHGAEAVVEDQWGNSCKMPRYDDRCNGYDRYSGNTKLYVGRLSTRTRMQDLEHLFSRYGRVRHVDLKYDYGFVEFSDPRDADDARHELDGREFDGSHLIVEFAKGTPRGPGSSRDYMARGPPPGSGRCFNCGIDGHWANDCNAGDWKNKCYRCGDRGHIERNCQNSAKNLKRGRSYTRSPPPRRGRSQSRSYSRSRSRSHSRPHSPRRDGRGAGREERLSPRRDGRGAGREERLSPRRDGRGAGREERRSRSLGYSRSPRGSASPSQGRNRSPTPNVVSPPTKGAS